MKVRTWLAVGAISVSIAACSGTGAARVAATPTPAESATPASPVTLPSQEATPSASPSAAPVTMSCSATPAPASPLVIANTLDNLLTVFDFADPKHPIALCTMSGSVYLPRFISRTEIGYLTGSSSNDPIRGTTVISRVSLNDLKPVPILAVQGDVLDMAWSPDGSTLAYLLYTPDSANQLWVKVGDASPRALTPLIPLFGRDGSIDDQTLVRFSPDGKYVLMVDTLVAGAAPAAPDEAIVQVHSVPDGNLVWVPPSALGVSGSKFAPYVTMAAWSHQTDRLYYRDMAGVHTWDPPGTVATLVAGLQWHSPSVAPGDQLLAYDLVVNGQPHIEVRSLVSAAVQVLPGERGAPILLSDAVMIELHYGPNTQGPGPPYVETGLFVLNLTTNLESPLLDFGRLNDIWTG
jgi:hypothetical protein